MFRRIKIKSKRTLFAIGAFFALTGLIHFFEPLDIAATAGANKLRTQQASGEFVVVGMDDYLQGERGAWPWAQEDIANAIQLVLDAGASQVVLSSEIPLIGSDVSERLKQIIQENPDQVFIVEPARDNGGNNVGRSIKGSAFASSVTPVHAQPFVRFWGGVEYDYFALDSNNRILSSAAAVLANRQGNVNEFYPIDYSIDAKTIPYISLGLVHTVDVSRATLAGKSAILGFEAPPNAKSVKLLGQGRYGLATLIAVQAETLKRGRPVMLPWYIPWLACLVICGVILQSRRVLLQIAVLVAALVGSFFAMVLLNSWGIRFEVSNGWLMISAAAIAGISRNLREKTRLENAVHPISGLPSTDALRTLSNSDLTLVHLKIRRSSELLDILDHAQQKLLAQKVANLVSPTTEVWHGDNGRFYWFSNDISMDTAGQHFESLALIFRNGFMIDELNVSLEIVFGIDDRKQFAISDRVHGATMSAKQAIIKGVQWQLYEAADRSEATWSVTMLKELDLAIERGHIYAALQPKLDLKTGQIAGAEALARWHHPTKGLIQPDEFIGQADHGGRLLELTLYVLDNALSTCSEVFAANPHFILSVNIAPSLLESPSFPYQVLKIVEKHGIDATGVMLEITESSQFANDSACTNTMQQLRKLGFKLSIDDYGTANSTLEYLRKIPASELKIDRKFVSHMLDNESDYHMVASTIQLGHRLRMLVVAEGVEDDKTLHALKSLNCDIVQGYVISKPLESPGFLEFIEERHIENKKLISL